MKPEIPIRARAMSCFVLRCIEEEWQVLLLKRVGEPLDGEWCQVAGRLEKGETAWQGILRELKEETGLTPDRFYSGDICEQFYNAFADVITLIPVFVAYIDRNCQIRLNEVDGLLDLLVDRQHMVDCMDQRAVLLDRDCKPRDRGPYDAMSRERGVIDGDNGHPRGCLQPNP